MTRDPSEALDLVPINNDFYDQLGERWYTASDDPVALLRAEAKLKNPWILNRLGESKKVLDMACGAGFLSNALAASGHDVTAIDLSEDSLRVARLYDRTKSVRYLSMDAGRLAFPDASFDAVFAMDFLEHVEDPSVMIREAARVLKPGGIFFFHTFNRNLLSYLLVIKGVEWFVKNTPKNMHVLRLFVKPSEVRTYCAQNGLRMEHILGVAPVMFSLAFWKMLLTGRVPTDFRFRFTRFPLTGFSGIAIKN